MPTTYQDNIAYFYFIYYFPKHTILNTYTQPKHYTKLSQITWFYLIA
ncbi:hypothetical protein F383_33807 [Gossypium arboreum]|uniref:Uncharacterized protein n=1 Tax=Gossypium arboreum TaxID=29729 RepID=A0A0B0N4S1_GOSAR|nr:hypothetical protein F383_33807 [Gossypium arboreum]